MSRPSQILNSMMTPALRGKQKMPRPMTRAKELSNDFPIKPEQENCNRGNALPRSLRSIRTELTGVGLQWKRSGSNWHLFLGRRRFGRVVPDAKYPGMFRSVLSSGRLSDMANLAWAKNAVLNAAVPELEWEARHDTATDPQKSQQNGAVFRDTASPVRKNSKGRPAAPIVGNVS
jgi:hypothetical protein